MSASAEDLITPPEDTDNPADIYASLSAVVAILRAQSGEASVTGCPALDDLERRLALATFLEAAIDAHRDFRDGIFDEFWQALIRFGGVYQQARSHAEPAPSNVGLELCRMLQVLGSLAEETHDLELFQRVLEWMVCAKPQGSPRAQAYAVLAEFFADRLGDLPVAGQTWELAARESDATDRDRSVTLGYWERAFAIRSEDADVAEHLIHGYVATGDWASITAPFEVLLRKASTPASLKRCVDLLLALKESAIEKRQFDVYVALIDHVLWGVTRDNAELSHDLLKAKSVVLSSTRDQFDAAIEAYYALIDAHARQEDIDELISFIRADANPQVRYAQLVRLYEWQIARTTNPIPHYLQWAKFEECDFANLAAAAALCERVVAQQPDNVFALREIRRLHALEFDWAGVAHAIERLSPLVSEPERSALDFERAELLLSKLKSPEAALETIIAALSRGADPEPTRPWLVQLLSAELPETRLNAAVQLVETCVTATREELQIALRMALSATFDLVSVESGPGSLRASALRLQWFEQALTGWSSGDEEGFNLAAQAVCEFPDSDALWDALQPWSNHPPFAKKAIELCRAAIERETDRELIERLGKRMVSFAEATTVEVDAVLETLVDIMRLVPGWRWALDRVKLHLGAKGRFSELLDLYERAADEARANGDSAGERVLLNEASVAAKDLANEKERAIRYLERLCELDPEDVRLSAALERLYERCGYIEPLIAHLSRRLSSQPEEAHQIKERIASLWISTGQYRKALEIVLSELERDAELGGATKLLEQILSAKGAEHDRDPETSTAERAAHALTAIYRRAANASELVRILTIAVAISTSESSKIAALAELARIHEGQHDDESAFKVLSEALCLNAGDHEVRQWYGQVAARLRMHDEQVATLVRVAETHCKGDDRARVLYEAACVTRDNLHDAARAIELFGQVVDVTVDDKALMVAALSSLESLLKSEGYAEERCNALECLIEATQDYEQRRYALREAAQVCAEVLGDPERAAAHFRALLDDCPSDSEALDGFTQALSAQERWEDLAQTLLYRIGLHGDPKLAITDRKRLAELYETKLGEPDAALAEWRAVLREDPRDRDALDRTSDVLAQSGRWDDLVAHLTAQIPDSAEPAPLYRRLADIHRNHTLDLRAAATALARANDIQGAAELLWGEQGLQIDDVKLRLGIADSLRSLGQVQAAIRVLSVQIEVYGERRPKERSLIHLALARALLTIDDPQLSLRELGAAIAIDPTNPEILAMHGKLALELSELDEAERSYRALLLLALHTSDVQVLPPALSVLYFRLAQIAERREDTERAQEFEASAFDAAFSRPSELLELERALLETRSDKRLAKTLEGRLARASGPEEAAIVLFDFTKRRFDHGQPASELKQQIRETADRLMNVMACETDGERVLRTQLSLVPVYRLLGDIEAILPGLKSAGDRFFDSEVGLRLQAQYARALLTIADSQSSAIALLKKVWSEGNGLQEVADDLLEALGATGNFEEQAMVLEQRVRCAVHANDIGQANALRIELGATLERASKFAEALSAYDNVEAGTVEHRRAALEAQCRILSEQGIDSVRRGEVLERLVALSEGRAAAEAALKLAAGFEDRGFERSASLDRGAIDRAVAYGFAQDPSLAPLRHLYVAQLTRTGQSEAALRALESARSRFPADKGIALELAGLLESSGNLARAVELIGQSLDDLPNDAELNRRRWQLLVKTGQMQEALKALDQQFALGAVAPLEFAAVIHDSGLAIESRRLCFREVELLVLGHAEEQATERLSEWLRNHSDDVQAHREYARLVVRAQRWDEAANSLAQLVQIDSAEGAVAAALDYAVACDRLGDPARSIPALERAKRFAKEHEELDLRLLKSYEALKMYGRMAELYVSRSRRAPVLQVRADLLLLAAQHFARANTSVEAFRCIDEALAIEPDRLSLILAKAKLLRDQGAEQDARELLLAALEANRYERILDRQQLLAELAQLHLQSDELIEAQQLLGRAFGLDPDEPHIALLFGLVSADLDDPTLSSSALRAALSVKRLSDQRSPLSPQERAAAYAELSRQELAAGHRTAALELFEKAVEQDASHHAVVNLSRTMQALVG